MRYLIAITLLISGLLYPFPSQSSFTITSTQLYPDDPHTIRISWDELIPGTFEYMLQSFEPDTNDWLDIGAVPSTETYTDVSVYGTYQFRVIAYDDNQIVLATSNTVISSDGITPTIVPTITPTIENTAIPTNMPTTEPTVTTTMVLVGTSTPTMVLPVPSTEVLTETVLVNFPPFDKRQEDAYWSASIQLMGHIMAMLIITSVAHIAARRTEKAKHIDLIITFEDYITLLIFTMLHILMFFMNYPSLNTALTVFWIIIVSIRYLYRLLTGLVE